MLQAFQAAFKSLLGQNGYIEIPLVDVNLGPVVAIVQWGQVSWLGQSQSALENSMWPVTFPIAFPTTCLQVWPQLCTNSFSAHGAIGTGDALLLESGAYTKTGAQVFADYNNGGGKIYIANPTTGAQGFTGFNWIAIGY